MSKLYSLTLLIVFVLLNCELGSTAMADMAAPEIIPIEKVVSFWQELTKKEPKYPQADATYEWAVFARDVIKVDQFEIFQGSSALDVKEHNIIWAIKKKITESDWTQIQDKNKKNIITKWRSRLQTAFGATSYQWAWVLFQLGEKKNLKKTLQQAYAAEFDYIMKLSEIDTSFDDHPPLLQAQAIHKNLDPLSTTSEKKSNDSKMQKMKVHISNLPASNTVT